MANPRMVLVHRRTELDELLDRHGTRGQVEFFLKVRNRGLAEVQAAHDTLTEARAALRQAAPAGWRTGEVERADLSRFLMAPDDVVVVVGQDGLVANTAKYLAGQPVIGVNAEPGRNPGVLVRHSPRQAAGLLARMADGTPGDWGPALERLSMVTARTDDGQELSALNEVFLGHASHQSARYELHTPDGQRERQSSSGLIVSTGTGATGWCASIAGERGGRRLPAPTDPQLAWFVREAWPSPATGATLTEGVLQPGESLTATVSSEQLVVFGDGMEDDRLTLTWGQEVLVGQAAAPLHLVAG
ncbi:hypothetical protein [Arthrobacter sp. RAF14]|uniref:hypothetical protein n=1 Tax=Arthrobacter sp. RAF14 TaxID=3233051 RepID=UPI003F903297